MRRLGLRGSLGERRMGRPELWMGREPGFSIGRPCDGPGCAASADPSMSFARLVLRIGIKR